MKITLQQMRYMLKIAETGSMVAASRVLSVSQPSLSEAVSVVERELGFSLFTRGNTGATPTKEGMEFLGRARQVVLQMDNLERRYGGNQPEGMRFAVSSHHFTFVERAFLTLRSRLVRAGSTWCSTRRRRSRSSMTWQDAIATWA